MEMRKRTKVRTDRTHGVCSRQADVTVVLLTLPTRAGIQTSENAHFYAMSSRFSQPFNNEGKTLVVQFTVKHEQSIDCGGGYIKVFPSSLNQAQMEGESEYNIMFGECGRLAWYWSAGTRV